MSDQTCSSDQTSSSVQTGETPTNNADATILPLAQKSVQWTLTVFAAIAVIALLSAAWNLPGNHEDSPGARFPAQPGLIIDINAAQEQEFAVLPGVGPILAKRIVDDRTRNGRFGNVEQLARVHGIGPKKVAQICVYCTAENHPDSMVALAPEPTSLQQTGSAAGHSKPVE